MSKLTRGTIVTGNKSITKMIAAGALLFFAKFTGLAGVAYADDFPTSKVTDMGSYWYVEASTLPATADKSDEDTGNLKYVLNNATSLGSRDVRLSAGTFVASESILVLNYRGTLRGAGKNLTTIVGDGTGNPADKDGRGNPENVLLRPTDEVLVNINLLAEFPVPGTVQALAKTLLAPSVLWFTESSFDFEGNAITPKRQKVTLRDFTITINGIWHPNSSINPSLVSVGDKDFTTGSTEATRLDVVINDVKFEGKPPEEGVLNVIGLNLYGAVVPSRPGGPTTIYPYNLHLTVKDSQFFDFLTPGSSISVGAAIVDRFPSGTDESTEADPPTDPLSGRTWVPEATASSKIILINNEFETVKGVYTDNFRSGSVDFIAENNSMEDVLGGAILSHPTQGTAKLINNDVSGPVVLGFLNNRPAAGSTATTAAQLFIIHNTLDLIHTVVGTSRTLGLALANTENSLILANHFLGSAMNGVVLTNCEKMGLIGNDFDSFEVPDGQAQIVLNNTSHSTVIGKGEEGSVVEINGSADNFIKIIPKQ